MLPFPIISNTMILPPRVGVKKMQGTYDGLMYLDDTGTLYGYGNNSTGIMSSLPASNADFTVIDSGVTNFWCSVERRSANTSAHTGITVIRKGSSMYFCGQGGTFNTSYMGFFKSLQDITSLFSSAGIVLDDIKDIVLSCDIGNSNDINSGGKCFVLMNNGDLYFIGKNLMSSNGLGQSANAMRTTFILCSQNVQSVCCSAFTTNIVLNDGTIQYSGSYMAGSATSSTWTVLPGQSGMPLVHKCIQGVAAAYFISNDNKLYAYGMIQGTSSRYAYNLFSSNTFTDTMSICKFSEFSPRSYISASGNTLVSSGLQNCIGINAQATIVILANITIPSTNPIIQTANSTVNSWYLTSDNILYGTGSNLPKGSTSYNYTKIF